MFDEFDAIGAQRAMPNETGEIRRVLNSFLQFIEQDNSLSIIIAATNHVEILDGRSAITGESLRKAIL